MTNTEKLVSAIENIAQDDDDVYEVLTEGLKVPKGFDELDDQEYEVYKRNLMNESILPRMSQTLQKIGFNDEDSDFYIESVNRANAQAGNKFDRDYKSLVSAYGLKDGQTLDDVSDNMLVVEAAGKRTTPDVLRAEIENAKTKKSDEDKLDVEKKDAAKKAKDNGDSYRTGVSGFVLNDNSKDDFERGNTARGVVSEILSKGATAADFGSGLLGPTPWGFFASAVGPTLRLVNNNVLHDNDKPAWDQVTDIGTDYTTSILTQAIPGSKLFSLGKGAFERIVGGHTGDVFLTTAENAAKEMSAKQGVKQAGKDLQAATKAYEKAAQVRKQVAKRGSGATKAEKAVAKEMEAEAKKALNAAKDGVKQAESLQAQSAIRKKFGEGYSTKTKILARGIPEAGREHLRYLASQKPDSRSSAERIADELDVDATTIRMWRNGFKPHGGEELDKWNEWNSRKDK